ARTRSALPRSDRVLGTAVLLYLGRQLHAERDSVARRCAAARTGSARDHRSLDRAWPPRRETRASRLRLLRFRSGVRAAGGAAHGAQSARVVRRPRRTAGTAMS